MCAIDVGDSNKLFVRTTRSCSNQSIVRVHNLHTAMLFSSRGQNESPAQPGEPSVSNVSHSLYIFGVALYNNSAFSSSSSSSATFVLGTLHTVNLPVASTVATRCSSVCPPASPTSLIFKHMISNSCPSNASIISVSCFRCFLSSVVVVLFRFFFPFSSSSSFSSFSSSSSSRGMLAFVFPKAAVSFANFTFRLNTLPLLAIIAVQKLRLIDAVFVVRST
mmetsp:Transcript_8848/g.28473  ORF Transcript_8848/g.28473 Transcript_8848/m.28473 type:complete len:220 (+) Transcript_8848:4346-5005(+)